MNVVPDVLSSLHPSFDLRLTFPESRGVNSKTRVNPQHKQVEPGVFLVSEQVLQHGMHSLLSMGCSLTGRLIDPKPTNRLR